jgi:hypothetical protein
VIFALGGTAQEGIDFHAVGTSVTILTGHTFADVIIVAIADGIAEIDETVTMTVANVTQTVTIQGQEYSEMPKLVINEIHTTAEAWIELHNTGAVGLDLTNWFLTIRATGATPSTATYVFPTNFAIPVNGYVVVHEGGGNDTTTNLYVEIPMSVMWNFAANGGSVAVSDSNTPSAAVDYVVFGQEPVNPPTGTTWVGIATQTPTDAHSLARDVYSTDTNQASDWEITSGANSNTPTPNAANMQPIVEIIEEAIGLGGGATCAPSANGGVSAVAELMALFAALFVAARLARRHAVAR